MNPCLCTCNGHSRVIHVSASTKRKKSLSKAAKSFPSSAIISGNDNNFDAIAHKLHLFVYLSYDRFVRSLNTLTWLLSIGRLWRCSHNPKASQVFFCFAVRAGKAAEIDPTLEFTCLNAIWALCKHTRSFQIKPQPLRGHTNSFLCPRMWFAQYGPVVFAAMVTLSL